MRSWAKSQVKLNIQKPRIDGLPDSYQEYVVLGIAHHEIVKLDFGSRHPVSSFLMSTLRQVF